MTRTLRQFLSLMLSIGYDDIYRFRDDDCNVWVVSVEESSIPVDDSIPENELTEADYEYYPFATVRLEDDCYTYAESPGDTIAQAIGLCLIELELIGSSDLL